MVSKDQSNSPSNLFCTAAIKKNLKRRHSSRKLSQSVVNGSRRRRRGQRATVIYRQWLAEKPVQEVEDSQRTIINDFCYICHNSVKNQSCNATISLSTNLAYLLTYYGSTITITKTDPTLLATYTKYLAFAHSNK